MSIEFNKKESSFTLIELLIIMAIIGLLSSILLVGLAPSREQAKDARIILDMAQMRREARIIQLDYDGYNVIGPGREFNCTINASADMRKLCDDIDIQKGPTPNEFPIFRTTINEFCSYIQLPTGVYYCIEEERAIKTDINPATTCTSSSWDCPPAPVDGGC